VKIAVAQVIAIGHVPEAIQQDLPLRLVEEHGSRDASRQPTLLRYIQPNIVRHRNLRWCKLPGYIARIAARLSGDALSIYSRRANREYRERCRI
jgi:hypothetical protein